MRANAESILRVAIRSKSREGSGRGCSKYWRKLESPDMPDVRCVTTEDRNCHRCLAGCAIESMGLGPKAPCSSSRLGDNSDCVMNGILVSAQGHKVISSLSESVSSFVVR